MEQEEQNRIEEEVRKQYFGSALSDFTTNFAYGDAIGHLVRRGYTPDRIMREFGYPLSRETIERIAAQKAAEQKHE